MLLFTLGCNNHNVVSKHRGFKYQVLVCPASKIIKRKKASLINDFISFYFIDFHCVGVDSPLLTILYIENIPEIKE